MRKSRDLRTPSSQLVEQYWKTYLTDYCPGESAVRLAFREFPKNGSFAHIHLKVSVLNDVFSTSIYDTRAVAEHIRDLDVDRRLQKQDPTLVNEIAAVPKSGRRFYSFASKYCSNHEPEGYAIYDSYVDKLLWAYQRRDGFSAFRHRELKDYIRFLEVVDDFCIAYHLDGIGLEKLDKFLWLHGKELF